MGSIGQFEVLTFDCYGTLIDWETGIQTAFKQALTNLGLSKSQENKLFDLYEKEEKRIEGEKTYRPYRKVLAQALVAAAKTIGKTIPNETSEILAKQLPTWRAFPDTKPALERLAKRYRLGILSNVDDDLIAGTLRNFTVPFDLVVTAEQVRSYKPGFMHFERAQEIIGERKWLHVAASIYHDIEPALELNLSAVWVNRTNSKEGRNYRGRILRELETLTQLADWLAP